MGAFKDTLAQAYAQNDDDGNPNKYNCSGFLREALKDLGFPTGDLSADGLIDYMDKKWSSVGVGEHAKANDAARAGFVVVAGARSTDYDPQRSNGHVVIVVPTDADQLYQGKYPKAWGGDMGKVYMSEGDLSVGEIFNVKVRDKVRYYTPPDYGPQVQAY